METHSFFSVYFNRIDKMSYDPACANLSDEISCARQYELAKMIADEQTNKLQYMVINPACNRMTQLADRVEEHQLQLGRPGLKANNSFCRVMRQVSILDFPNNMCLTNKQDKCEEKYKQK